MQDLLINLVANFIWVLIGSGAIYAYRLFFQVLPTKRLWQLHDPNNLMICISTSALVDTGEYYRPTTGIGQVRGLTIITSSLNRAYKIQVKNVLLSEDQILDRLENDIILLGGPENNRITNKFLDKIRELSIIDQKDNTIYWKVSTKEEIFKPTIIDRKIIRDYGMIIRMKNPFSPTNSTICLLAGTHTYGTIAATRFFTENL